MKNLLLLFVCFFLTSCTSHVAVDINWGSIIATIALIMLGVFFGLCLVVYIIEKD